MIVLSVADGIFIGLNSLCDLVLTILPCFILWHLHMPIGTKIGLGAVLTLSIL